MMRFRLIVAMASLSLCACATAPGVGDAGETRGSLAWLAGCWVTPDGSSEERWHAVAGGYLFGSNIALDNGDVVFFEQMRIGPGDNGPVLHAYPRGIGPTSFDAAEVELDAVTFVNADNDYPQRIRYERDGDALKAVISMLDGTRPYRWTFEPCGAGA